MCVSGFALVTSVWASVLAIAQELYPASPDGRLWGYIDHTGRMAISPRFEVARPFFDGRAVVRANGKMGYIDETGSMVIEPIFDLARRFEHKRAIVSKDKKWDVIDGNGSHVVEISYDTVSEFNQDRAIVSKDKKWGVIDTDGKPVVELQELAITAFSEDRAIISDGVAGKPLFGVMDVSGAIIVQPKYEHLLAFSNGLAVAQLERQYGYIDRAGNTVIPHQYTEAHPFRGRFTIVRQSAGRNRQSSVIDRTGTTIFSAGGLLHFLGDDRYLLLEDRRELKFIELPGVVIPIPHARHVCREPTEALPSWFPEDLQCFSDEGQHWYYTDKAGRRAFARQFKHALPFKNGRAIVGVDGNEAFGPFPDKIDAQLAGSFSGVIDRRGEFISPPIFDEVKRNRDGSFRVRIGSKWGQLKPDGQIATLSKQDIDAHVAVKRAELQQWVPIAGRTITARAGPDIYRLRLPERLCATTDADAARRAQQRFGISAAEYNVATGDAGAIKKDGFFWSCPADQLGSSAPSIASTSYGYVSGTHKEKIDASGFGAVSFMWHMRCGAAFNPERDKSGESKLDASAKLRAAMSRPVNGEPVLVLATATEAIGCHSAKLRASSNANASNSSSFNVEFSSEVYLRDWLVQMVSDLHDVKTFSELEAGFFHHLNLAKSISALNSHNMK